MKTANNFDHRKLDALLYSDREHPHIHLIDMPFRMTSTWQDHGCDVGLWEQSGQVIAWALFQPAWWNLDYAVLPALRGTDLEQEIFLWGKEQMAAYAERTGEAFWGSVELFENSPRAAQTMRGLEVLGFTPFDWTTDRFELDLSHELPPAPLPDGFTIRPLHGTGEVQTYVNLHRAAFGSERMTAEWRARTLQHPAYRAQLDLIVEDENRVPVGFCICWQRGDAGQIEPLGIHPDYQGRGLGRALESAACEKLKRHGARLLKVDHVSLNENAVALSLKTGFRQTNKALRYYVDVG